MGGGDSDEGVAASLAIKDGKISAILPQDASIEAEKVFDATGMIVSPGFVDIHVHDEYFPDADTVQRCLIRQGVTTAVAGNCGSGPLFEESSAAREKPWLNLSYLVGNCAALREAVGRTDRYTPSTGDEIARMKELLRSSLKAGAKGLSLGLEYAPGTSFEEISALASVVSEFENRIVTVHIRYDDDRCIGAVQEVIRLSEENRVRLQVSHLGSMTMYHTRVCAELITQAAARGVDVAFDCYPYDAFCARAGSAVYDDGFVERWKGKGPECLEAASGRFKGQRLTFESLAEMRSADPMGLIVAHVMDKDEIEECIANPACIIASDALCFAGGGGAHPRIAGTFPRALRILRGKGYSWGQALSKMTTRPAERMGLDGGRLFEGSCANVTVFDPENFTDRATFQEPFLPPDGLRLVVINGQVAFEDGNATESKSGKLIRF